MEIIKNLTNKIITRFQKDSDWYSFLKLLVDESDMSLLKYCSYKNMPLYFRLYKNDSVINKSGSFTSATNGGVANEDAWQSPADGGSASSSSWSDTKDGGNAYSDYVTLNFELPYGRYKILNGVFNYKNKTSVEIEYQGGTLYIGPFSNAYWDLVCLESPTGINLSKEVKLPKNVNPGAFYNLARAMWFYSSNFTVQTLTANGNSYKIKEFYPISRRLFYIPNYINVTFNDSVEMVLRPQLVEDALVINGYHNGLLSTTTDSRWTLEQMNTYISTGKLDFYCTRTNKFNYSNGSLPIKISVSPSSYNIAVNFIKNSIPSFINCPVE